MAVLSFGQLTDLWRSAGGDPLQADTAAAIALAESGGRTDAINNTAYPNRPGYHKPAPGNQPEYSVGLWQINIYVHTQYTAVAMLTPTGNVRAAIAIHDARGNFTDWSTFNSGAYKSHLLALPVGLPTAPPVPATGLSKSAAHSLSGWHKLSTTLGGTLPRSLAASGRARRAALRALR